MQVMQGWFGYAAVKSPSKDGGRYFDSLENSTSIIK